MVSLTRRAESDLAGIADYTMESFGIEQARRYIAALEACFHTFSGKPSKGRSAEEIAPRLRRFRYKSHVVFFIPGGEGVLIVRVLHESMDFHRHL